MRPLSWFSTMVTAERSDHARIARRSLYSVTWQPHAGSLHTAVPRVCGSAPYCTASATKSGANRSSGNWKPSDLLLYATSSRVRSEQTISPLAQFRARRSSGQRKRAARHNAPVNIFPFAETFPLSNRRQLERAVTDSLAIITRTKPKPFPWVTPQRIRNPCYA